MGEDYDQFDNGEQREDDQLCDSDVRSDENDQMDDYRHKDNSRNNHRGDIKPEDTGRNKRRGNKQREENAREDNGGKDDEHREEGTRDESVWYANAHKPCGTWRTGRFLLSENHRP